eukprot:symbB.v1.2.033843.t1/scaffold4261.1/size42272/2
MWGKLKVAQQKWSEKLVSDEKFCDAVAILGAEGHRRPFLRAHLAAMSEPLCAALYGEFQEANKGELVLKDVHCEAFDVILRCACHLPFNLTPQRAIYTLKAAKLYLIDELQEHCLDYLGKLSDSTSVLQAMTAAVKLSHALPEDVQKKYWVHILLNSKKVLESPAFIEAHGCIIAGLIKLEEFAVDEEVLWSQLLKWSANAVRNAELLGPFADATGDREKRLKNDCPGSEGLGMNELAQQGAILEMISRHIRFAAMSKTFFFDKARTYLTRDHCDAVIAYFLLNRKSGELLTSKREFSPEELLIPPFLAVQQCGPKVVSDDISRLVTGSGSWTPTREKSCLMVELKEINLVTRVELTFSPQGVVWPCRLSVERTVQDLFDQIEIVEEQINLEVKGRTQSSTCTVGGTDKLHIRPQYPTSTSTSNAAHLQFIRKAAAVTSIKVWRKKNISKFAKEVVQCKSEELLSCTTAPSIPMNGTDGESM